MIQLQEKTQQEVEPRLQYIAAKVIKLFAEEGLRLGEVYEIIEYLPKYLLKVQLPKLQDN